MSPSPNGCPTAGRVECRPGKGGPAVREHHCRDCSVPASERLEWAPRRTSTRLARAPQIASRTLSVSATAVLNVPAATVQSPCPKGPIYVPPTCLVLLVLAPKTLRKFFTITQKLFHNSTEEKKVEIALRKCVRHENYLVRVTNQIPNYRVLNAIQGMQTQLHD